MQGHFNMKDTGYSAHRCIRVCMAVSSHFDRNPYYFPIELSVILFNFVVVVVSVIASLFQSNL